jgi:hypothetical protein
MDTAMKISSRKTTMGTTTMKITKAMITPKVTLTIFSFQK